MSVFDAILAELVAGHTAFILVGLVLAAAAVRRFAPEEQRRVRVLTMLVVSHLVFAIAAGVLGGADLTGESITHFASIACAALAGTGMVVNVVFVVGGRRLGLPLPPILHDLVGAAAYLVVLIVLAGRAGINIAGLVATSAVLTAVVGLALQDTLGNLVAGLTLQSDSTLRIGEWVSIGDIQGRVVEMRWRFTALETRNGETLIIPNAVLIKDKLRIIGRRQGKSSAWRRRIDFSVDYRAPHARVIDAVQGALRSPPLVAGMAPEPAADCIVINFAPGAVDYAVRYWLTNIATDDPVDSEVRRRITAALQRAGLEHAYPLERRLILHDTQVAESDRSDALAHRHRVLARIGIFAVLTEVERDTLVRAVTEAQFERGEVLFRQGAPADCVYVVDDGEVAIRILGNNGLEHGLAKLGAGDVLGEMGVMTGDPRSATAVAETPVRCFRIGRAAFETLLRGRPEIAEALGRVLTERQAAQASARGALDAPTDTPRVEASAVVERIRAFFGLDAH